MNGIGSLSGRLPVMIEIVIVRPEAWNFEIVKGGRGLERSCLFS